MTNKAEVFAARQASRKHREWLEREAARETDVGDVEFAPPADCWGMEVTPAAGKIL